MWATRISYTLRCNHCGKSFKSVFDAAEIPIAERQAETISGLELTRGIFGELTDVTCSMCRSDREATQ